MTEDGDIIYHYCSVHALLGIIDTGSLWLTNVRDTNDKTEFSILRDRAFNLIKDSIKGAENSDYLVATAETLDEILKSNPYICSFSMVPDLLSQWRGYGVSGHGVAIGFSKTGLKLNEQAPIPSKQRKKCLGIHDVIYVNDDTCIDIDIFTQHFKGLLNRYNTSHDKTTLFEDLMDFIFTVNQHSILLKHQAFAEEQEVRIIYTKSEISDRDINPARTSTRHELPFGRRIIRNQVRKYYIYKYPTSSLVEIVQGSNCDLSEQNITQILTDKNPDYRSVKIRKSICPLRD